MIALDALTGWTFVSMHAVEGDAIVFILQVVSGPQAGQRFPLSEPGVTIGRRESGIVLDDAQLSRQHARFDVRGGQVVVTDLGSANGTLVNGQRIAPSTPLRAGDVVQLGGTTLRLENAIPFASVGTPLPGRSRLPLILGGGLVALLLCACVGIVGVVALSSGRGSVTPTVVAARGTTSSASDVRPASTLRPGWAVGRVTDQRGQPITKGKVTVRIEGQNRAGGILSNDITPDATGHYELQLPEGQLTVRAFVTYTERGKQAITVLDPTDARADSFNWQQGIVKDFQWKLTGLQPGADPAKATSYYGAALLFNTEYVEQGQLTSLVKKYPGAQVLFTLTPRGALIDGSSSAPITKQLPLGELKELRDIPLGSYTLTARLLEAGGATQPLHFPKSATVAEDVPTATTLDVDWEPVSDLTLYRGGWRPFSASLRDR